MDFAMSAVAAAVALGPNKTVTEARIVLGGVAPIPWRVPKAESALTGKTMSQELLAEVAKVALQGAELAVKGDTTAVTSGLGISFNSTLVALTLSIVLMYTLHEIQLAQERLVLDAENYADEELISRLHSV